MLKHKMLAATLAVSALGLFACGSPQPTPPVRVSLIAMNDFHGNLLPPTGSTGTVTVPDPANAAGTRVSAGGAAFLATVVANLKSQNPGNTLVVGAGDLVGASPLSSALFHDEPTIDALNQIGLDVTAVGNHEFDKGPTELRRLQNGGCFPRSTDGSRGVVGVDTCMTNGTFAGAKFQYLAANVVETATKKTLFAPYAIRTVAGEKIAFIGMTLKDTPSVVTPAGVEGLQFSDEVTTVNNLVPELVNQGVSAIVVLLHQGAFTTASTVNDKTCPGLNGDIGSLTDKLDPRIDVVVSGHSHTEYICTRPDGKLLTQAGFYGKMVTKIDLMISPDTHRVLRKAADTVVSTNDLGVKDAQGNLIPVPAAYPLQAKNSAMDTLVQRFVGLTAPITNQVIGNLQTVVDRTQNRAGESQLGDIIGDIYLNGSIGPAYGSKPAQIAFSNPGGIRANLSKTVVTYGDLFTVTPFGNNLVTVDLTGQQILRLLEQQWEAPQPAGGRIMQVSNGFSYTWDGSKPEGAAAGTGSRIVAGSMKLNGVALDLTKTYRVTVNNFMATGGDNYTVLRAGTNSQAGDIDIDAGVAYFRKVGTVSTPPQNRITRIN
jgi:5'-nucleotidase